MYFGNQSLLLNTVLILLSFVFSYVAPVELFLFSYSVLGPLHYFTEIAWLNKKSYFVNNTKLILFLVFNAAVITISQFLSINHYFYPSLVFANLIFSYSLVQNHKQLTSFLLYILAFMFGILFGFNIPLFAIIFGILLTTVIHVFVFTVLFMFSGYLKSKSKFELMPIVLLLLCVCCIFIYKPIFADNFSLTNSKNVFLSSGFNSIITLFQKDLAIDNNYFQNETVVTILRFIAFAYTYHYINWFLKTKALLKGVLSIKTLVLILVMWFLSVLLYLYNFELGLTMLFFASILHVFLEFPLNFKNMNSIFGQLHCFLQKK